MSAVLNNFSASPLPFLVLLKLIFLMLACSPSPESENPSTENAMVEQNPLGWELVFHDDFSDPAITQRWIISGGLWKWSPHRLLIENGTPQLLILKQPFKGDIAIEYEAEIGSQYINDITCLIGVPTTDDISPSWQQAYQFKFGGFDNTRNSLIQSSRTLFNEYANPLVRHKPYRLRAEKENQTLRFYVDGQKIFEVEDPEAFYSLDPFHVGIFGWQSLIHIRSFKVFKKSTSNTEPLQEAIRLAEEQRWDESLAVLDRLSQNKDHPSLAKFASLRVLVEAKKKISEIRPVTR